MALLVGSVIRVDASPCPGPASVAVFAENLSADSAVTLHVEGQLLDAGATCDGAGATTYATTLDCAGAAAAPCGRIEGLRPGAWVHRVRVQVNGSDEQAQSQRSVVLATAPDGANIVSWTCTRGPSSFGRPTAMSCGIG